MRARFLDVSMQLALACNLIPGLLLNWHGRPCLLQGAAALFMGGVHYVKKFCIVQVLLQTATFLMLQFSICHVRHAHPPNPEVHAVRSYQIPIPPMPSTPIKSMMQLLM